MEGKYKQETIMFPIEVRSMIEGEKNKLIKLYLGILDDLDIEEQHKRLLRNSFLNCINGFSRFSKGLLKNYVIND
jgi:hypothetical protein